MANLSDEEVFARTVYAEARGEPPEGQRWVAWVIKNRAHLNQKYWGEGTIKNVCLHQNSDGSYQFECWRPDKLREWENLDDRSSYATILAMVREIKQQPQGDDPSKGSDHYHNPSIETWTPEWKKNCDPTGVIGGHAFFRTKAERRVGFKDDYWWH